MIGRRRFGLGAAALAISSGAHAQAAKTVLRVVPQAEPQVFDPHQSGVNATQEHAALVYDTLFSWDADMVAAAADGGGVDQVRRWPAVQLHAAPWTEVPRPYSGDVAGCRRHSATAAGARYAEPDSRQPGGGAAGQGRQNVHAAAQGAVPLRRVPAVRQQRRDGRHHAREGCADRSVHADEGAHRLRPVPLRRKRVSTGQPTGL